MENTKIEWATNTFNPFEGCSKISPGCANCYAEERAARFGTVKWGPSGTRRVAAESYWKGPVKWNREAAWCGNPVCKAAAMGRTDGRCACGLEVERPRVFCASLADVFEDWTGPMIDARGNRLYKFADQSRRNHTALQWIDSEHNRHPLTMQDVRRRLFKLIDATPNLDWLLVTKRPENIPAFMPAYFPGGYVAEAGMMNQEGPRPNVWLIASVENQPTADERIQKLFKVPAVVHGLSIEPLLGPIDVSRWLQYFTDYHGDCRWCPDGPPIYSLEDPTPAAWPRTLGWAIIGGESGNKARPCNVKWMRDLIAQLQPAKVATFIKQLGADVRWNGMQGGYGDGPSDIWPERTNKQAAPGEWLIQLNHKKGGDIAEFPPDLAIRQFPTPKPQPD